MFLTFAANAATGQTLFVDNVTGPLTYTPSTGILTSSVFQASSDYRIKTNVENLDCYHVVDKLRPVTYYNTRTKNQDMGFIAHEVQEIYPFLVNGQKDGEDIQSINYNGLISVLVKEIKEQKMTIKDLTKRIEMLENKIE
jgi:hypothetical protein